MSKRKKRPAAKRPPSRAPRPPAAADATSEVLRIAREVQRPAPSGTQDRTTTAVVDERPAAPVAAPARRDEQQDEPAVYGVAPSYWLNLDSSAGPRPAMIRFEGTRLDESGRATGERFESQAVVPDVAPGIGWVSVTSRVSGLLPGQWRVKATPVGTAASSAAPATTSTVARAPRRVCPPQAPGLEQSVLKARLAPLTHGPGVTPVAWPVLVLVGVVVALLAQALLVRRAEGDVSSALALAGAGTVVGYLSAKAYFMVQHRVGLSGFVSAGTCIQGFLLGAFGTVLLLAPLQDIPVLRLVDLTTPGVFFAMAIGRPGCWFGGCCAGRPTTSRWGLWSSDRTTGVRRLPVQLVEATVALAVGGLTLALELSGSNRPAGVLLAAGAGLYTLGRQVLFPLRQERRRTTALRTTALVVSSAVGLGALVLALL